MMTTYYLDHRETGETQVLDGWSYLLGAVAGPLYVLLKGFLLLALLMIPISAAIAGVTLLLLMLLISLSDSPAITVSGLFTLLIAAFAVHGVVAVELVRRGFLQKGWREGYY